MKKVYLFCIVSSIMMMQLQAQTVITVNPSTKYQTIEGLGGGNAGNEKSDPNVYKYLVDYLGMSEYRQWMDTQKDITIDQINNGTVTFPIFDATNIAFHKKLHERNIIVIGAVLSPPAILKKNLCLTQRAQAVVGGPYICGQACAAPMCANGYNSDDPDNILLPEYYDEYARYLALYAKKYKQEIGDNFYAISLQNEPMFNEPYGSCVVWANEYAKILQHVADTFAKYPEISDVKFYGAEHMAEHSNTTGNSRYIPAILEDESGKYKPYLYAFAVHGYSMDGITPDLGSNSQWEFYKVKIIDQHGKKMWMSETSSPSFSEWTGAYGYMKGLFSSLKSGQVSLWSYNSLEWMYSKTLLATRQFANNMHFYRFIRPGAQMIETSDTDKDVEVLGFIKGSDVTLIAINLVKTPKTISFGDFTGKPAFFHVYQSTSKDYCVYVGKVTDNNFVIPGESVVTITYDASNPNTTFGPNAVSNLATTSVTDNAISISWTAAAAWTLNGASIAVSGYSVYIDGVKKTVDGPITKTNFAFSKLSPGTKYKIEVFTRDAMGNDSYAATIEVITTCEVGGCDPIIAIENPEEVVALTISPNPASDYLSIALPDSKPCSIVMMDITGRVVRSDNSIEESHIMDIQSLPAGMYIVMANNGTKIYKAKVLVE